jgi:probable rRNA maturation factor
LVILQKRIVGLSEAMLERFVLRARRGAGLKNRVNVLVTNSAEVRALNRQFGRKNKATDVLSFPSQPSGHGKVKLAGDIAISGDIAAKNAARLGHSAAEEIKILTLHGILHLAGLDHERDNGEMARKEIRLRQKLRLPVGLIERTESATNKSAGRKLGEARGREARKTA